MYSFQLIRFRRAWVRSAQVVATLSDLSLPPFSPESPKAIPGKMGGRMAGDVLVAATCIPDPGQARRKINALKHSDDAAMTQPCQN